MRCSVTYTASVARASWTGTPGRRAVAGVPPRTETDATVLARLVDDLTALRDRLREQARHGGWELDLEGG